jgi:hypothetical protein
VENFSRHFTPFSTGKSIHWGSFADVPPPSSTSRRSAGIAAMTALLLMEY